MIAPPPIRDPISPLSLSWQTFFQNVYQSLYKPESGTTTNRPTQSLYVGRFYFDTSLNKPIWYSGAHWVDATGTTV